MSVYTAQSLKIFFIALFKDIIISLKVVFFNFIIFFFFLLSSLIFSIISPFYSRFPNSLVYRRSIPIKQPKGTNTLKGLILMMFPFFRILKYYLEINSGHILDSGLKRLDRVKIV